MPVVTSNSNPFGYVPHYITHFKEPDGGLGFFPPAPIGLAWPHVHAESKLHPTTVYWIIPIQLFNPKWLLKMGWFKEEYMVATLKRHHSGPGTTNQEQV